MITQKTSRVSRLIVTGTLALAILASGAGGYLVGLSDASTRGDVAQPASDLAAFRASEHQGSAENPSFVNTGASDTIKFLATEHQGSAENPSFVNTGASDTIKFLATEHQGSAENPNATK